MFFLYRVKFYKYKRFILSAFEKEEKKHLLFLRCPSFCISVPISTMNALGTEKELAL